MNQADSFIFQPIFILSQQPYSTSMLKVVSVFQREGYWDFQNPKKKKKKSNWAIELLNKANERSWYKVTEKEKWRIIPWEKKEDDRVVGRPVWGGQRVEAGVRRPAAEGRFRVTVESGVWEWGLFNLSLIRCLISLMG